MLQRLMSCSIHHPQVYKLSKGRLTWNYQTLSPVLHVLVKSRVQRTWNYQTLSPVLHVSAKSHVFM